ncbi:MAG: putative metal-binding motif-containing protein [Pseudomonadota bacterium]|nr:putative metal-binding motif-containing protein [Pseudomonadota bacterium]
MTPLILYLAACSNDVTYVPASRVLDSYSYVDAGVIAVDDRQSFTVPLFSRGSGPVTVFAMTTEDVRAPAGAGAGAFIVHPEAWTGSGCDKDGDGADDCLELASYDDDSDGDTLALPVIFAPTALGAYEGLLTIWSNDTESTAREGLPDDPATKQTIWRIQLRGRAGVPCARVWPTFLDLGSRPSGGEFSGTVHLENCGVVSLVVSAIHVEAPDVNATSSVPLYLLPGGTEDIRVAWHVPAEVDGQVVPTDAQMTFTSNAASLEAQQVAIIGNLCSESIDRTWDADLDGWSTCGGDCDDGNRTINPSQAERAGTGRDENCDGAIDEAANPVTVDDDGDGVTELEGDCDDGDATNWPGAVEIADGVDQGCDGVIDNDTERFDDDGDGWSEREGDCDDSNRFVSPAAPETPDGVDNDCDGIVDEGGVNVDDDGDGFTERDSPDDCDDHDPWAYPDATEFCDAYDNDCDGLVDEGPDGAAEGACAFIPTREVAEVPGTEKPAGCAAFGGAGSVLGMLLAATGLAARRRAR